MCRFVWRLAGSVLLCAALLLAAPRWARAQYDPPLPVGKRAPAFTTTTLAGKPLSLKSLRGKVVLLDFWATWCGPCRMAVPMLQSLHKRFAGRGLEVVGMSMDDASTSSQVKPFQREMKTTYTLAVNPKANVPVALAYNAEILPSLYLIDRTGVVRWSQSGFLPDDGPMLAQKVEALLGSGKTESKTSKISRK